MTFSLASSTDTQEEVNAAAGITPEVKTEDKAAEKTPEKTSDTPADDKSKKSSDSGPEQPADQKKDESKSDAESGTADEEEEDEGEVEEEEEEDEEKEEGEKQPLKKKGGLSRRVDKLTKEKSQLAERLANLEGQLAEKNKAAEKTAPKDDPEPKAADFTKHEDYIAAIARWNTRQENKAERERVAQAEVDRTTRETYSDWNEAVEEAREKYDDFDTVVGASRPIPRSVQVAIIELGQAGTDVAYYLGQHPELCTELLGMSDARAVARIGRLEAKLHPDEPVDEKATDKKSEPPKKSAPVSRAPEPFKPVAARATTAAKSPEEMNLTEFREYRKKTSQGRFRN